METVTNNFGPFGASSKRLVQRLLTMGENRLELLVVEVQEERKHLLHAIVLALGVAAFGLLAGVALTGVVVVIFLDSSPIAALLTLTGLYAAAAVVIYRRLTGLLGDWQILSATLDQLRKDRACLEKHLE